MERELKWKVIEVQNDAIPWGVDAELDGSKEEGWPGVLLTFYWPDLFLEEPLHTHSWPSVDGGVRIEVDICSVVEKIESHSTCSACDIGCCFVANLL
jgi:hypothetical protein